MSVSNEVLVLIILSVLYLVAWLPASMAKSRQYGFKWLASNRRPPEKDLDGWGGRAERAHSNLITNFPAFVAAILLVEITGSNSGVTCFLAWAYLVCRLIHFAVYCYGHVGLRALSWALGLFFNIGLLVAVLV